MTAVEIPYLRPPELVRRSAWEDAHETRVANWIRPWDGEEPFDVVVCDLRMAGLGAERLHELLARERPGLGHGIVLTTGDTVSLEPERVAESTGAFVLHKPFDLGALRDAVRSALARRRTD